MRLNPLPVTIILILIGIEGCTSASTPVATETQTFSLPSPTKEIQITPNPTHTIIPATKPPATKSAPTHTATPSIPDIGEDLFYLSEAPMEDDRIGLMKFRLMELGYMYHPVDCPITTNIYTHVTDAAILSFQEVNGLDVDGVVGPITWAALFDRDAIPAPKENTQTASADPWQGIIPGTSFMFTNKQIWSMDDVGTFTAFQQNGEFEGFYMVRPLPGEEDYLPAVFWFDGTTMWVAQQGPNDALVQAYDPLKASPVDGLLAPKYGSSIHFPSHKVHPTAASDGEMLWFLTENADTQSLMLQSIHLGTRTAGNSIRLGHSSGYNRGYSLAWDEALNRLWLIYGDEFFGEGALVWIDIATGEIGGGFPYCGRFVTKGNDVLWIGGEVQLSGIDTSTGKLLYQTAVAGRISAMHRRGEEIWVMTEDGTLYLLTSK